MHAMATIQISQQTTMGKAEFQEAIDQAFATLNDMYNLSGSWNSDTEYSISGSGIHGTVTLRENSVNVTLSLGTLLLPFADTIKRMIATALKDRLK